MVLMRVENGDIKREWVHFSLHTDVPSLPPEALEGAFGKGATMLHVFLHLLGLIVEDFDLVKEERRSGFRRGGGASEVHAAVHAGRLPWKNLSLPLWGPVRFQVLWVEFFFSQEMESRVSVNAARRRSDRSL